MELLERRRVKAIISVFLLFITLPYLWVALLTPSQSVWGGLLYFVDDPNVHLAWARQVQEGHFFMANLFTTEALSSGERPLFFNVLPAFIGILARLTGLAPVWIYHGCRVFWAAVALWQFYRLCAVITPDRRARLLAMLLAAFATGGGFLLALFPGFFGQFFFIDRPDPGFPMMPEAFVFTSAFLFPLNIASYALLAFLGRAVLEAETGLTKRTTLEIFGAALLLANIHTYDALPFGATVLLWGAISLAQKHRGTAWACLNLLLGLAVSVFYQAVVFGSSEEFRLKALTPTPAPAFQHIGMSLLPLLLPAGLGLWRERQQKAVWFLALWIVATLALIYAPVSFARKMIEGAHWPLCALAGLGWSFVLAHLPMRSRRIAVGILMTVLALSPGYFVVWCLNHAAENNLSHAQDMSPPIYISRTDWAALKTIAARPERGAILCSPHLGSYAPRETGHSVFIGHWAETLHPGPKLFATTGFYAGKMKPGAARDWLKANHIQFVIEGPFERFLGRYQPSMAQKLALPRLGFWNNDQTGPTTLYKVPD